MDTQYLILDEIIKNNFKKSINNKKYECINIKGDDGIGKKYHIKNILNKHNYNIIEVNLYTIKNKESLIKIIKNNTKYNAYILYNLNNLTIQSEKDIKTSILKINNDTLISPIILINDKIDKYHSIKINQSPTYFNNMIKYYSNKYNIEINTNLYKIIQEITNFNITKLHFIIKKFIISNIEFNENNLIDNTDEIYITNVKSVCNSILLGVIDNVSSIDCTSLILYLYENAYKFIKIDKTQSILKHYIELNNIILKCDIINNTIYYKQLWLNVQNIFDILVVVFPQYMKEIHTKYGFTSSLITDPTIPKKTNIKKIIENKYFTSCINNYNLTCQEDIFQILKTDNDSLELQNIKEHIMMS